ncbi:MAG: type I phosphomannose isomerase catalytic subunit [Bacteroidales bacterium]
MPSNLPPVLKERIWGGDALRERWGKDCKKGTKIGESWEISGLENDLSVVSNGFLEGNNIGELVEVYMGDLVGESIYEKFGNEFPLLIKIIDARDTLSIQVHPDNQLAKERHNAYGKSEAWFVLEADPGSSIYNGFRDSTIGREEYSEAVETGNLPAIMNVVKPVAGDSVYIPAGTLHALGSGLVVAEIQQTSDVTYRVYDWDRKNEDGSERELHTDLAIDAIDFSRPPDSLAKADRSVNGVSVITECEFFTVSIIRTDRKITRDYSLVDSFIIYLVTEGNIEVEADNSVVSVSKGETLLIPAVTDYADVKPDQSSAFLEIFIKTDPEINSK